jgi:hypothetical protein
MRCVGSRLLIIGLLVALARTGLRADESQPDRLARELRPFLSVLNGQAESFALSGTAQLPIDGGTHTVEMACARYDADSFTLRLVHRDYEVALLRNAARTALVLPRHQVIFWGHGDVPPLDQLRPAGILGRVVHSGTTLAPFLPLFSQSDPAVLSRLVTTLLPLRYEAEPGRWRVGEQIEVTMTADPPVMVLQAPGARIQLQLREVDPKEVREDARLLEHLVAATSVAGGPWAGYRSVELPREELERQLTRGARRALEIAMPSPELTVPREEERQVDHGELRWIGGQRVALVYGTPEEVGRAHGQLLAVEAQRCIDSVLYTFGTVQTIVTGRWFRHDLEEAYARLAPHIPADHQLECRALADSLGMEPELAQVLNVFPELFHCSGFALAGAATRDGKLYHGRVLDYMTTIGLQDAATTFIVVVEGKIPFANIGYAGFIGSVSGMNAASISLGEMGGRGEGEWDGVPMATLMRLALEQCSTLDEVVTLWKTSPRTCEYYYVFADGKTNEAVGVAADPNSLQLVRPGEGHPLLGEGIRDAVILSAGSRLEKLRERVQSRYGEIDAEVAQWLMTRPVAMNSNLHNVLFVPADHVFYVANATHRQPAADRPYVRFDLRELLESMPVGGRVRE